MPKNFKKFYATWLHWINNIAVLRILGSSGLSNKIVFSDTESDNDSDFTQNTSTAKASTAKASTVKASTVKASTAKVSTAKGNSHCLEWTGKSKTTKLQNKGCVILVIFTNLWASRIFTSNWSYQHTQIVPNRHIFICTIFPTKEFSHFFFLKSNRCNFPNIQILWPFDCLALAIICHCLFYTLFHSFFNLL